MREEKTGYCHAGFIPNHCVTFISYRAVIQWLAFFTISAPCLSLNTVHMHPFMACMWLRECCRQVGAEMVSNSTYFTKSRTSHKGAPSTKVFDLKIAKFYHRAVSLSFTIIEIFITILCYSSACGRCFMCFFWPSQRVWSQNKTHETSTTSRWITE